MKTQKIEIRVTPEEKKQIKKLAHKHEMTVSEYMLHRALEWNIDLSGIDETRKNILIALAKEKFSYNLENHHEYSNPDYPLDRGKRIPIFVATEITINLTVPRFYDYVGSEPDAALEGKDEKV